MKPVLGILLGEATGVGPEIIAKLCAEKKLEPYCKPLLIGDLRVLRLGQKIAGVDFPVEVIDDASKAGWDEGIPFLDQKDLDPSNLKLGNIDTYSGKVTGNMLITALRLCQQNVIKGFTYAPLHKGAMKFGGHNFEDEQKLMAHYLGWNKHHTELNVLNNLWTSRVTSHIPHQDVAANLSREKVLEAIKLIFNTLRNYGIEEPRIAVAALNPHAGESGSCGREEIEIIGPAVQEAKESGINAAGPFSSDVVFVAATKGLYDAVVTMYHDQGQIAIKLLGFQFGVTVAGGLPYPITTPAHGTAFDIAGKGIAMTDATLNAVIIAARMAGYKEE